MSDPGPTDYLPPAGHNAVQITQITGGKPFRPATPRLSQTLRRYFPFCTSKRQGKDLSLTYFPEDKILQTSTISTISLNTMGTKIIAAEPYNWPCDSRFDPSTTALVIIDMQKDFCSPEGYLVCQGYDISPVREMVPRLQILLHNFRAHGFPIYYTREGHRSDLSTLSTREQQRSRNNESGLGIGDNGPLGRLLIRGEAGHDIIPELYPLPHEPIIDKPGRSAFQHTDFNLMLSIKGIKNLIFSGVTTDVCVHSTMREANDNGFDCLLVRDATAASEKHLHDGAVESIKAEGGIFGAVSSTESILAALHLEEHSFASVMKVADSQMRIQ